MKVVFEGRADLIMDILDTIDCAGVEFNVISSTPLHFGVDTILVAIQLVGSLASLIGLLIVLLDKCKCNSKKDQDSENIIINVYLNTLISSECKELINSIYNKISELCNITLNIKNE